MTTRFLTTRRSPEDCFERLERIADGVPPMPGLSVARAKEENQLLGRVGSGGFSGAYVDGVPGIESGVARLVRGVFGFRMAVVSVRVKVAEEKHGSLVRVSFHPPVGDAALIGLVLGASLALLRESLVEMTAAFPIALGIYLFMPLVRRRTFAAAQADVVHRVSTALDAKQL